MVLRMPNTINPNNHYEGCAVLTIDRLIDVLRWKIVLHWFSVNWTNAMLV